MVTARGNGKLRVNPVIIIIPTTPVFFSTAVRVKTRFVVIDAYRPYLSVWRKSHEEESFTNITTSLVGYPNSIYWYDQTLVQDKLYFYRFKVSGNWCANGDGSIYERWIYCPKYVGYISHFSAPWGNYSRNFVGDNLIVATPHETTKFRVQKWDAINGNLLNDVIINLMSGSNHSRCFSQNAMGIYGMRQYNNQYYLCRWPSSGGDVEWISGPLGASEELYNGFMDAEEYYYSRTGALYEYLGYRKVLPVAESLGYFIYDQLEIAPACKSGSYFFLVRGSTLYFWNEDNFLGLTPPWDLSLSIGTHTIIDSSGWEQPLECGYSENYIHSMGTGPGNLYLYSKNILNIGYATEGTAIP